MKEEILERLRKVFDYKGIKKASDIQHLMDFNHTTASNYYNGKQLPDLEKLSTIAQTWEDVNIHWILTGDGKMIVDKSSGTSKLDAFRDDEILTYIYGNQKRFKEHDLTKRVFDALFIKDWMESLKKESDRIKAIYEERYGPID